MDHQSLNIRFGETLERMFKKLKSKLMTTMDRLCNIQLQVSLRDCITSLQSLQSMLKVHQKLVTTLQLRLRSYQTSQMEYSRTVKSLTKPSCLFIGTRLLTKRFQRMVICLKWHWQTVKNTLSSIMDITYLKDSLMFRLASQQGLICHSACMH